MDVVGTSTAVEHVVSGLAVEGVVAVAAAEAVVAGVAGEGVVAGGRDEHFGFDAGHVPGGAIGKLEVLHHVAGCPVGVEVALHAQAVVGAVDADQQVLRLAGQGHAGGQEACAEQNSVGVGADRFTVVVVDRVLACAFAEQVHVGPAAAVEVVVARASVQGVVAGIATQGVAACLADQNIIAIPPIKGIRSSGPHQQIRPRGGGEVVFSGGCDADCPTA